MNKQDMMKVQTCVLRVNIHCEGCKDKIKKRLKKIQNVYKVHIDAEQGKVTVSGNVDPKILIEKLEKAGKHAELWGGQNRQNPTHPFNNFSVGNPNNGGKDNRSQKGVKDQQKGVVQQAPQKQQIQQQSKGFKDMKFLGKDHHKSGKFDLSEDEEEYDEFDDEFDDDESSDGEFGTGQQTSNAKAAHGVGHQKGKDGAKNAKKGLGYSFLKGMLGKTSGKSGNEKNSGKVKAEKGNQDQGGGKKGVKNGVILVGDGKSAAKNGKGDGKTNDNWSKKAGEKFEGLPKMDNKQQGFKELNPNHRGISGGNMGMMGNYPMGQMGHFPGAPQGFQMGNFPGGAQGMPAADHFGQGQNGNPHNQQQYMQQMMMMNQQRGNGQDMYHPMMFNRPMHPAGMINYGPPPPPNDKFTHIFSDENTDSCSIM